MSHQAAKRERFMGLPADQYASGRAVQARGGEGCKSCPTSCPHLTENGCTIAVGNERIACPAEDECLRLAMLASGGKKQEKFKD